MFTFTKFVVVDSIDHSTGMMLVSFSNKYIVYNASRRRVMTDIIRLDSHVDPAMLITDANVGVWISHDRYRVSPTHTVETLSYPDAILYTNDRYDVNQMMRAVIRPASASDGRLGSVDRRLINLRVETVVNEYIEKQSGTVPAVEPSARFKGGYYYHAPAYKLVRSSFKKLAPPAGSDPRHHQYLARR